MNRRTFIINYMRVAILMILTMGAAWLLFRKSNKKDCDINFACGNCSVLNKCALPQAVAFKKKTN